MPWATDECCADLPAPACAVIVRKEFAHGTTVFRIEGHIDSRTSGAFQAAVLPAVEAAPGRFALDLSRVSYVSSTGLRVMLLLAKRARALGGSLVAIQPNNPVREVFIISGFTALIPILESEDALAAPSDGPDRALPN